MPPSGPTFSGPDDALDALLAGNAPDPAAAVRALFGDGKYSANVLRATDALLASSHAPSDKRLTLTLIAAMAPALQSDHIARLLENRVIASGGLPWAPIAITDLRDSATRALSTYPPDRAVRLVDDLLARQQRDALRYVPATRWTPEMVAASHTVDDDLINLDRILNQGRVEEDDLAWLTRRGRHLAEDGWINDSPVGEVIVRTAPADLVVDLLAVDPPTNTETVTAIFSRSDLAPEAYRNALLVSLDSRALLGGTSLESSWGDVLSRALRKPDLWDTTVPVEDRGKLVSELPTDATRFAGIVPRDALDAFIERLLPGEPGTDRFQDAVEALSDDRHNQDRLLSAVHNGALSPAGAAKLRDWCPDARQALARRKREIATTPPDQVAALRSLGRSLLKQAAHQREMAASSRSDHDASALPRSIFMAVTAGEALSAEEWATALASADPVLQARITMHPDCPHDRTMPVFATHRVRNVAIVSDAGEFPPAPRTWNELPTRPDLFSANDPAFALEAETVTIETTTYAVRVISSAAQLEANGEYMGNCTENYREAIEAGTTRLVQLVDDKNKIRYNVELIRGDARWSIGEVNTRFNRGASPKAIDAVAALAEALTTATRWFGSAASRTATTMLTPVAGH